MGTPGRDGADCTACRGQDAYDTPDVRYWVYMTRINQSRLERRIAPMLGTLAPFTTELMPSEAPGPVGRA